MICLIDAVLLSMSSDASIAHYRSDRDETIRPRSANGRTQKRIVHDHPLTGTHRSRGQLSMYHAVYDAMRLFLRKASFRTNGADRG